MLNNRDIKFKPTAGSYWASAEAADLGESDRIGKGMGCWVSYDAEDTGLIPGPQDFGWCQNELAPDLSRNFCISTM